MYHRIAVTRTILECAYFILRDGIPYRERIVRCLTRRLNRPGLAVTLAE